MQNVGTLGIHAKHTQHSPAGLINTCRLDFGVALNTNVTFCFDLKVHLAQEDCIVADGHAELQDTLPTSQCRLVQFRYIQCKFKLPTAYLTLLLPAIMPEPGYSGRKL